jgi:hypothetical protein
LAEPRDGSRKTLHFGGSKVGGWVYHKSKLGAKMEIPAKMEIAVYIWDGRK